MTEQELRAYIEAIRPADETAMDAARRRQAQLAKPPGSLGQLEELSIRLAGVTGQVCPAMDKCRVAVFAADNGVVAEGVSCTPPSVTLQQAVNMTFRKTGMSAMAAPSATMWRWWMWVSTATCRRWASSTGRYGAAPATSSVRMP